MIGFHPKPTNAFENSSQLRRLSRIRCAANCIRRGILPRCDEEANIEVMVYGEEQFVGPSGGHRSACCQPIIGVPSGCFQA